MGGAARSALLPGALPTGWPPTTLAVIDRMIEVTAANSFATALSLSQRLCCGIGPATSTSLMGVIALARKMICVAGERYGDTVFGAGR